MTLIEIINTDECWELFTCVFKDDNSQLLNCSVSDNYFSKYVLLSQNRCNEHNFVNSKG